MQIRVWSSTMAGSSEAHQLVARRAEWVQRPASAVHGRSLPLFIKPSQGDGLPI